MGSHGEWNVAVYLYGYKSGWSSDFSMIKEEENKISDQ